MLLEDILAQDVYVQDSARGIFCLDRGPVETTRNRGWGRGAGAIGPGRCAPLCSLVLSFHLYDRASIAIQVQMVKYIKVFTASCSAANWD
jgi:hypothetical protein